MDHFTIHNRAYGTGLTWPDTLTRNSQPRDPVLSGRFHCSPSATHTARVPSSPLPWLKYQRYFETTTPDMNVQSIPDVTSAVFSVVHFSMKFSWRHWNIIGDFPSDSGNSSVLRR